MLSERDSEAVQEQSGAVQHRMAVQCQPQHAGQLLGLGSVPSMCNLNHSLYKVA